MFFWIPWLTCVAFSFRLYFFNEKSENVSLRSDSCDKAIKKSISAKAEAYVLQPKTETGVLIDGSPYHFTVFS